VKGEENLWRVLCDKFEMLRAGQRLPDALRVSERALELARRVFPETHPSLALSYERVGQIHDLQGNCVEARAHLLKALQIVEKIQPVDQRVVYRLSRRLAFLCDGTGREDEAIPFYEVAIKSASELGDISHSDLGTMLNNVALIYRRSGRQQAAEPYYLHALSLYEKQLGPEHPDVAAILNNLGVFYTNERRFEEAERMHQRALSIRRKLHRKGHPDIAQSHCNLAVVYHSRGDLVKASELYKESLRNWEEVERPSQDYEIVASNYAGLLRSLGKNRKAATVESRARRRRSR
jgi:tetratricopeptide (TPR) repeat protein